MQKILIAILIGYFIGSISFAAITAKIYKINLQKIGSQNIGATNLSRAIGIKKSIVPLILDIAKTIVASLIIAKLLGYEAEYVAWAATFVIIGHIYPWWNKFKGGKGVASTLGFGFVVFPWWIALGICYLIILIAKKTKVIAYGTILAITLLLVFSLSINSKTFVSNFTKVSLWKYFLFLWILIIYKHKENIKRIIANQENKINLDKN